MDINISGVNKAKLLAALYNNARPQGMGWLQARHDAMTEQEATDLITAHTHGDTTWFDYVHGRPIKVGFKGDTLLRADLYDRDAPDGDGSAERIVDSLR